jgi:hypothetical protein
MGYLPAIAVAIVFNISGAADATPIQAVFTGTVVGTEGTVDVGGFFGAPGGNLTGASYSAKFIYDIDSLGPVISESNQFASYVTTNSVYWAEVTMNGHTVVIDGFATPGDVTSALWDKMPGWMFGKSFGARLTDSEDLGNNTFLVSLLTDNVFSDQLPLLSITTPFTSDNANFSPAIDIFSGSLSLYTFGSPSDFEEIFDFMANSVTVSPVATAVPEPLSLTLMGAGLFGLAALRRRSRVKASAHR